MIIVIFKEDDSRNEIFLRRENCIAVGRFTIALLRQ